MYINVDRGHSSYVYDAAILSVCYIKCCVGDQRDSNALFIIKTILRCHGDVYMGE